jgi:hypothetical protein
MQRDIQQVSNVLVTFDPATRTVYVGSSLQYMQDMKALYCSQRWHAIILCVRVISYSYI